MQPLIVTSVTIVIFYCAYKITKANKLKRLFLFYSIYLAILGFLFKPDIAYDLYMHYGYLDNARRYGLTYLQTTGKTIGLPTYQYLFYLFSKFPVDNFLGMFTAFVINYFPLMVIYHYGKDHMMYKRDIMLIAVLFLCSQNYIALVSNVRTPITYALFVYVFYYENKNKRLRLLAVFIYFVLVFLHPSILLPIGLRYIFIIPRKKIQRFLLILLLGSFAMIPYFISYSKGKTGLIGYMGSFLYEYIYDTERNMHNIQANLTYTLRMITTGGIILYILFFRYIQIKGRRSNIHEYVFLGIALVMISSLGSSYHFFLRYASLLQMMIAFPMCTILTTHFKNRRNFATFTRVISLLALISNFVLQYRMAEFAVYLFK